jgi:hypothetical protein
MDMVPRRFFLDNVAGWILELDRRRSSFLIAENGEWIKGYGVVQVLPGSCGGLDPGAGPRAEFFHISGVWRMD